MNAIELEAYKAELAREILNINDRDILNAVKEAIQKKKEIPCLMSVSTAKLHLAASEERFRRGEFVSEEAMDEFFQALI